MAKTDTIIKELGTASSALSRASKAAYADGKPKLAAQYERANAGVLSKRRRLQKQRTAKRR